MRILQLLASVNPAKGGPVECAKQIVAALVENGDEVHTASCDGGGEEWIRTWPGVIHALGPGRFNYSYSKRFGDWLARNCVSYDLVVVHGIWQYHSYAAAAALRKRSVPYIVFVHGMLGPWFKKEFPLKHLKKWLYWPWGDYLVLRFAAKVIYTCERERDLARRSFWLYSADEEVCGLGVVEPPINRCDLRAGFLLENPQLHNKRLLLFLGRIGPVKGCDTLIRAFSEVCATDARLHLVLAGPYDLRYRDRLNVLARKLGIDTRITWTGMVVGDVKWALIEACEVLCLPSHHENFGMVVAEALACSKPVLLSDAVNISEIVTDAGGAFSAPPTVAGTADALRRWLALDEHQKSEMQEAARRCFTEHLSSPVFASRLLEIINAVTRRVPPIRRFNFEAGAARD